MSDIEASDDENFGNDPMISDAAVADDEVPDLRDDLIGSYGNGVLEDHQSNYDLDTQSVFDIPESTQPLDYSKTTHQLSDSDSDDETPVTGNPLRNLIKDAEKVKSKLMRSSFPTNGEHF
jgi:hypothetical protein